MWVYYLLSIIVIIVGLVKSFRMSHKYIDIFECIILYTKK